MTTTNTTQKRMCDVPRAYKTHERLFRVWDNMITRSTANYWKHHKRYTGTTVHPDWYLFSNFYNWAITMDGHDNPEYTLDKDMFSVISGLNKHYSPSTCCFLPRKTNIRIGAGNKDAIGEAIFARLQELAG